MAGNALIVEHGERFFEMKIATLSFLPGGISNSVPALKLQKLLQGCKELKLPYQIAGIVKSLDLGCQELKLLTWSSKELEPLNQLYRWYC
jgi:hypothetical protein